MANQYEFTPELKARIIAKIKAIQAQTGHGQLSCPICGRWDWEMPDGFATVSLLSNVWTNNRMSGLPCAAYVCTTCGNTLLFNLVALGFARDIGPDMDEMRKRWSQR